jgi:hypothetical protein
MSCPTVSDRVGVPPSVSAIEDNLPPVASVSNAAIFDCTFAAVSDTLIEVTYVLPATVAAFAADSPETVRLYALPDLTECRRGGGVLGCCERDSRRRAVGQSN